MPVFPSETCVMRKGALTQTALLKVHAADRARSARVTSGALPRMYSEEWGTEEGPHQGQCSAQGYQLSREAQLPGTVTSSESRQPAAPHRESQETQYLKWTLSRPAIARSKARAFRPASQSTEQAGQGMDGKEQRCPGTSEGTSMPVSGKQELVRSTWMTIRNYITNLNIHVCHNICLVIFF
jgi:hypothetical protein